MELNLVSLWAVISIWLCCTGATLGQTWVATMSVEVLWKNPKIYPALLVQTIIWIALIESVAIYWLIIAFKIISIEWLDYVTAISAWLAMWITWLFVWLWEWKLASASIDALNRNPDNKKQVLQFMIFFTAFLEVAAIYWLIIAYKLLS